MHWRGVGPFAYPPAAGPPPGPFALRIAKGAKINVAEIEIAWIGHLRPLIAMAALH